MTTAAEIEDAAHALRLLFQELNHAKTTKHTTQTERKMEPNFGPTEPLPIWTLSDDAYFTELLTEYVQDAARYIRPVPTKTRDGIILCQWVEHHADTIATLPVAPYLLAELQDSATQLDQRLQRTRPPQPVSIVEHRQTARSICARLGQMGHRIQPATLRQWHKRGKITAVELSNGRNGYLLTEVLDNI